jgi:ribonuclease BN (tRNA processing enzyme)
MAMHFTVIGCSPAWNNPGGANSGYLVEAGGQRLLVDCGPGVLPRLRQREVWPAIDAILISHWHLDHWGDLVPWVWGGLFGPGRHVTPPVLHLPPGSSTEMRPVLERLGTPDMLDRAFTVREYESGQAFDAAGFRVIAHHVPHYTIGCHGFRVEQDGIAIAYSADSGPSDALVELARDADLFVCEATLEHGYLEGDLRGHLDPGEAVSAFRESGAARLLLTHRPAELPLDASLERAHDGLELELGSATSRVSGLSA